MIKTIQEILIGHPLIVESIQKGDLSLLQTEMDDIWSNLKPMEKFIILADMLGLMSEYVKQMGEDYE